MGATINKSRINAAPTGFASNLADTLRGHGLSRYDLAKRMGVTVTQVSQWVQGEGEPKLSTFLAIARALGVDPACLYNFEEEV